MLQTYSDLSSVQRALLKKTSNSLKGNLICRVIYWALLVIAVAFGVTCIILIGVYFGSTGLVLSYLQNHNTTTTSDENASLSSGIQALTNHLEKFVGTGISEGKITTNETIEHLENSTKVGFNRWAGSKQIVVTINRLSMILCPCDRSRLNEH